MDGSIALGITPAAAGGAPPAAELGVRLARVLAGVKVTATKTEVALHCGFGSDGDDGGAVANLQESLKQLWHEMDVGAAMLWQGAGIRVDRLSVASQISLVPDDGVPATDDAVIEAISAAHDALSDGWDEVSSMASAAGHQELADFADSCSDAHDEISEALDGDDDDNGEDDSMAGGGGQGGFEDDSDPDDAGDDDEGWLDEAAGGRGDGFGGPLREDYVRHGQDSLAQAQAKPAKMYISDAPARVGARTQEEISARQAWITDEGGPGLDGSHPLAVDPNWVAQGAAIGATRLAPRAARAAGRAGARTADEVAARQAQLASEG